MTTRFSDIVLLPCLRRSVETDFRCLLAAFILLTVGAVARGGFIIDDFDETAFVSQPEQIGNQLWRAHITRAGVGPYHAVRGIEFGGFDVKPIGEVDVNLTRPSTFTTQVDGLENKVGLQSAVFVRFRYDFSMPIDFTHDGAYDALQLDVTRFLQAGSNGGYFAGYILPQIYDGTRWHQLKSDNLAPTETGYSIIYPFKDFYGRERPPGLADFMNVHSLRFEIWIREEISASEPLLIQLDKVNLVRLQVPEANSATLLLILLLFCISNRLIVRRIRI